MNSPSNGLIGVFLLSIAWPGYCHPGHGGDEFGPMMLSVDPTGSAVIEVRDGYRFITSTGIPTHLTGEFPNAHNPNSIAPQDYHFRTILNPKANEKPTEIHHGVLFGVALNGIVFDPGTAEYWRNDPALGWRMEAIGGPRNLGLDSSNAHVQPNGAYHYHGIPIGLVKQLTSDKPITQPLLLGYAADGYPIYDNLGYTDANNPKSPLKKLVPSYHLKSGSRPANSPAGKYDGSYTRDWDYVARSGDLDESNGRTGVTPEYPNGTYYYVLTDSFPFIPRSFHATPDSSFDRKGPPRGSRRPNHGPPFP